MRKLDIYKLVNAQTKMDKATSEFKKMKDEMCAGLEPGVYEDKYGRVTKTTYNRNSVNYAKIIEDNPDIKVEEYTEVNSVTSVTIKNLK